MFDEYIQCLFVIFSGIRKCVKYKIYIQQYIKFIYKNIYYFVYNICQEIISSSGRVVFKSIKNIRLKRGICRACGPAQTYI